MIIRRTAKLMLDRERTLMLTMRAAMRYDRETGRVFFDDIATLSQSLKSEILVGILWAALIEEDPELTIEQVADMVDLSRLREVMDALRQVLGAPEADVRPTGAAPAAAAVSGPDGLPSGPTGDMT